jgi:hypothetical protein
MYSMAVYQLAQLIKQNYVPAEEQPLVEAR